MTKNSNKKKQNSQDKPFSLERYGFYIRKRVLKNNSMPSYHSHEHYEILYIPKGIRGINFNNSSSCLLNFGNIALIKPHIIHKVFSVSEETQTSIMINLEPWLLNELCKFLSFDITLCFNNTILDLPTSAQNQINNHFSTLLSLNPDSPQYEFDFKTHIINVLFLLLSTTPSQTNKQFYLGSGNPKQDCLGNIIKYIDENYYKQVTISSLSKMFHYTPVHLNRLFKNSMNITLHQYLLGIRIINAKKLLDKQLPVSRVAYLCGFNSQEDFCRTFKKRIGYSPSVYKSKKQQT